VSVARTFAATLVGVTGHVVEVEADLSNGLPGITFTGLPDTTVVEARDRVRAAVVNSGADWPNRRITLALLPADLRKYGSRFDLALAVAILAVAQLVPAQSLQTTGWIGELGLDGKLRSVRGVLPAVLALRAAGVARVVVPYACAAEAALVPAVEVRAAHTLREVFAWLRQDGEPPVRAECGRTEPHPPPGADLADVVGQRVARRALELAAAGSHHLSLTGPPGAGKTMLAERLPGILPTLDDEAALEVTAVQSVAGTLPEGSALVRRPPFQAPHHSASMAALVGGGSGLARPGAVSLAHRGVLFLDEVAEFRASALDALRQPLEVGHIVLHRSGGAVTYPARVLLVVAANPCPCAAARSQDCSCPSAARRRYQQRVSGPLRDRIDIRLDVDPVSRSDLGGDDSGTPAAEPTAVVAARVAAARAAAATRWREVGVATNAAVPGTVLRRPPWRPPSTALRPLERALDCGQLTARGFDRCLRLSWTVADLAGHDRPDAADIAEALFFRSGRQPERAA
jgi:magnesium chelatase family protein